MKKVLVPPKAGPKKVLASPSGLPVHVPHSLTTLRTGRQNASDVLSIRLIFIFHETFALKNDSHYDKAEILSFLAKLIMHWYLAQDAFHRTFTLCSKT